MGVAVDEAGRDPAALAIDAVAGLAAKGRRRTGIGDAPVAARDEAVLDDAEAGRRRIEGREARIAPDAVIAGDVSERGSLRKRAVDSPTARMAPLCEKQPLERP